MMRLSHWWWGWIFWLANPKWKEFWVRTAWIRCPTRLLHEGLKPVTSLAAHLSPCVWAVKIYKDGLITKGTETSQSFKALTLNFTNECDVKGKSCEVLWNNFKIKVEMHICDETHSDSDINKVQCFLHCQVMQMQM